MIGTLALTLGIAALTGLIGTGLNHIERATDRNFNKALQEDQQAFNSEEAQKQREWEEQMSNTAYQRGTADMENAGLNPAMMYASGANAASTPSGSMASSGIANTSSAHSNMAGIINSVANVAHVMNYDKNKNNDMDVGQAVRMISNVANFLNK